MALQGLYVQYYRAPSPPRSAWRGDLERIAAAGFSGIQLRPQWRTHELRDNQFVWDDLHELCELAGRHGLRMVVQFIVEMAPGWFLHKYRPYRCDLAGAVRPPGAISAMYVGGWEPCYDHPAVPEHASRFITRGVEALKGHSCIEAWHVWNEPRSRPGWDCDCEHSVRAYRAWLQQRYGSIERLNEVTGKAWGAFEEVDPPTLSTDYTEVFLFRSWAVERVAARVGWAAAAARAADASRPIWSHVGFATLGQNPLNDGSPDWLTARQVDRYGLSMPLRGPQIGELDAKRWPLSGSMLCDWIRHVSPEQGFHAWEVYPDLGQGIQGVPAEQFGRWLWQAAASGPERICIWQYRSERIGTESADAGLVEVDGSEKPHRTTASEFIRTWNERREVLDSLVPARPKVWIAYDFASHMLWHVEQNGDAQYLCGPGPAHSPRPNSPSRMTLFRWYHIFRMAGFEVGWLSCDLLKAGAAELPEPDSMLVLPSLCMLDEDAARRMADWTRAGGKLLVVAGTGSREPSTFVREQPPGKALAELLGLTEAPYRWFEESAAQLALRVADHPQTAPVWPLAVARPVAGIDHTILARWPDDSPAALVRLAGAGQAGWLGAALDVDDAAGTAAAEQLISVLLEWYNLRPQAGRAVTAASGAADSLQTGGGGGWLSRPYELRLAEHPERGPFIWVFAQRGTFVELGDCGWKRAKDWLSGQEFDPAGFVAPRAVLCLSEAPGERRS